MVRQGHERLGAKRMLLKHAQLQGQGPRLGFEDADCRLTAVLCHVNMREFVKPFGKALIDGEMLGAVAGLDHITKRLERLGGERLNLQQGRHQNAFT
jgi:hypothetical protein